MVTSGRMIHPLAEEILRTGRTEVSDGSIVAADSFIPRDECELIYRMVDLCRPKAAVEVGMAYGVSTLCIADALARSAGGDPASRQVVSIDPAQTSDWRSGGIHLLERANLASSLRFIEDRSQLALPRLLTAGERFGFAFIDGWHTFDHTLIDFFYIDAMLDVGGVVIFDDVGYPAIHRVVQFILADRDYELLEALPYPQGPGARLRAQRAVKRWLRPLTRTNRDPVPKMASLFRRFEDCHAVAIRKRGDDQRRFDHFAPF
jgi:predicted O-methyltransferase YrrM